MKNKGFLFGVMWMTLLSVSLTACKDTLADDSHYQVPKWLKGNAYEVLEKEGTYSIFLQGVDLAGYKPIVNGKNILTVMAPDDTAFETYLKAKGYNSMQEMYAANPNEVKKLIGFHLLYYAFDWEKLVNFRPMEGDGATEEEKEIQAGYFYKFRTKSSDAITREWDPAQKDTVSVYHLERYIPIFSNKLFDTKGIDAKSNYEYFFPKTTWTGTTTRNEKGGSFNVANAEVLDADNVITDNGYLYHVSQVLDPMETVYTELKSHPKYSTYLSIYDSYTSYKKDAELTTQYGKGTDLYLHLHGSLPPIACEWPTSSYLNIMSASRTAYNVFAPSNEAIEELFTTYWTPGCGYTNLNNLDELILYYFIYQSFAAETLPVFPDEIRTGEVLTPYGTPINIDPDKVDDRIVCANGMLYGMDKMDPPAIFSSAIGPAFKDLKYVNYLYALSGSDLILSLASPNASFVTLMPDTAQFRASQMRLDHSSNGKELQSWSDEAGMYVGTSSNEMRNIVNMHVSSSANELNTASGATQVVRTNVAFNYWYVHDNQITSNAMFNKQLNPDYTGELYCKFTEIKNDGEAWDNGKSYSYSATSLFTPDAGDGLEHSLEICNDARYPYYLFAQLLNKAGLTDAKTHQITMIMPGTRFFVFIPDNEALKNAINNQQIKGVEKLTVADDYTLSGSVNSSNKTKLAKYLRSYFITSDLNAFSDYPFPGAGVKGVFDTYGSSRLVVNDDGSIVSVGFEKGQNVLPVGHTDQYHSFPFAFNDGGFHLIEGILLEQEESDSNE